MRTTITLSVNGKRIIFAIAFITSEFPNIMQKINSGRFITRIITAGVVMTAVFLLLMVAVAAIDTSRTMPNVYKSEQIFSEEGDYQRFIFPQLPHFQKDNFTDAIMVGSCAMPDSSGLIEKALHCNTLWKDSGTMGKAFMDYFDGKKFDYITAEHYSRYWFGFQVVLKPMLVWFDISEIRIINVIALCVLFIVVVAMIWHVLSFHFAIIFSLSLLAVGFPVLALSLQYSSCFYVAFLALIYIMSTRVGKLNCNTLPVTFFVIGGITSFLDLLTAPLLTLGLPLAAALLRRRDENDNMSLCLICICCWLAGYGSLWAMKWILATLFTSDNVLLDAMFSVKKRVGLSETQSSESLLPIIMVSLMLMTGLIICLTGLFTSRRIRYSGVAHRYRYLLVIALLPVVWVLAVRNHSIVHHWFVWRIFAVTIFCYFSYIYILIWKSEKKLKLRY